MDGRGEGSVNTPYFVSKQNSGAFEAVPAGAFKFRDPEQLEGVTEGEMSKQLAENAEMIRNFEQKMIKSRSRVVEEEDDFE